VVPHDDPQAFVAAAREEEVLVSAVGPTAVRLVTHLGVSRHDAEQAAKVLGGLTP
jgi:threonine aldolase